jgi:hypothetical protein
MFDFRSVSTSATGVEVVGPTARKKLSASIAYNLNTKSAQS